MSWKDVAETIGIGTIVVSLFLLAYEVRQNTKAVQQEAAATCAFNSIQLNLFVSGNSDFADIVLESHNRELSAEEQLRLNVFYRAVAQNWQNTQFQYKSGTLADELWESEVRFMAGIIRSNSSTWDRYWSREKAFFTD
jgi:hypothetical protein